MEYQYKVSVIVPVYNVEKYLRGCLDSLLMQTIDQDQMEVLLINDGSTDGSYDICKEYAEYFPVFKLFSKENEGVSETRNYGIKMAKGKYIMYLDADDTYSPQTIKAVTNYFDKIYNQVDVVTYLDQRYYNGKKQALHKRYDFLKETGIYELSKFPYIMQTRINICVKNKGENNVLFPTDCEGLHEDQRYNDLILAPKMKIGFCREGEYQYNVSNETSIMHEKFYPIYIFEHTISYYEDLFSQFDEVPQYYQAQYLNDLSWKLKSNILFPYYLHGEEFNGAVERLKNLIDRVDDDVILNNPTTDNFHRHYFLTWKHDSSLCTLVTFKDKVFIYKKDKLLFSQKSFEIILNKLKIEKNIIKVFAFVKSPLFNYIPQPEIYINIYKQNGVSERLLQELSLAGDSYYFSKEQTNFFWQFFFDYPIEEDFDFQIEIKIDDENYSTYFWIGPSAPFSSGQKITQALFKEHIVELKENLFSVKKVLQEEMLLLRQDATKKCMAPQNICVIRRAADANYIHRRVWLYYDCAGVEQDNGWLQFVHDFPKEDGIERFFIDANNREDLPEIYRLNIIKFGSLKHKLLYLLAETILTAYIEVENVVPFTKEERRYISDVSHAHIVYLQHGILHAHLPYKYVPSRIEADEIVVSSYFESKNFTEMYHFRMQDLVPVGMGRFDLLDRSSKINNRILFAPSWRNYLIGPRDGNQWIYTDEKFLNSNYFRCFNAFINSPDLEEILERNDLYLDFKIHPIFKHYLSYFDHVNSRVVFADDTVEESSYAMFITDFSSFVFDFGYLHRSILYFVPDWEEFISGMNQYRELDLPFEKAFGPLAKDADEAISNIEKSVLRNFEPEEKYMRRMEGFYLPIRECRENLYCHLRETAVR